MNLPTKRQRFTEEELKIIQEFYKRAPPQMGNSSQLGYFFPQNMQPWPTAPVVQEKKPVPSSEGLKNYITRAFSKCQSDAERDHMEKLIKEVIAHKKSTGLFNLQDWDKAELPLLPREQVVLVQTPLNPPIHHPPQHPPHHPPHHPQHHHPTHSHTSKPDVQSLSNDQIQKRKTRFKQYEIEEDSKPKTHKTETKVTEEIQSDWKIIGTSTDFEKPYFRLTSKPDPKTIRPENILKKALAYFKEKWRKGEIKYEYFSEQLRSIRQDLTVQGIRNKFSVEIYQAHIRLALEAQDLDQYNSCMSRLFELYKEGLPGRIPVIVTQEFKAYQIIYFTLQHLFIQLEKCLKNLTEDEKKSSEIKQAMSLNSALLQGNYHQVFQIRPNLLHFGPFLFDIFVPKIRALSLVKICKA